MKANCPDEEAGLVSYLQLYYCSLPHVKPIGFLIIALWTAFLFTTIGVAASDFFCINLSTISSYLGMSESLAGVTFLAFGNGSPDVFSTFAAIRSHSGSLAVGELIGAAGFITAVVAGSMALIRPFHVYKKSFIRDVGFFIVAVAFSMYFLANGSLALWECAVMVGFYVFYVVFVVCWHWYLTRRRRRRERDAIARGHYTVAEGPEIESEEEYHDDDEGSSRRSGSRPVSFQDFDALERAGYAPEDEYEDLDDEETRDKWMGELSSNMRVTRPPDRDRTTPFTPIRPSLVGALEFRAVLSSLQKSRNQLATTLNMRRYSDSPYYTSAQQQQSSAAESDPEGAQGAYEASIQDLEAEERPSVEGVSRRGRAVSANDAAGLRLDHRKLRKQHVPTLDLLSGSPPRLLDSPAAYGTFAPSNGQSGTKPSPIVSVTSPDDDYFAAPRARVNTADLLAPPEPDSGPQRRSKSETSPGPTLGKKPSRPHVVIPHSSKSPSPMHSPLLAALSSGSTSRSPSLLLPNEDTSDAEFALDGKKKLLKWWPYHILPPPSLIARTIFPTLYGWRKKSLWERTLGILAAPSFFLLAITLPVVEPTKEEEPLNPASRTENGAQPAKSPSQHPHHRSVASAAVEIEEGHHHHLHSLDEASPPQAVTDHLSVPVSNSQEWNRWLVLLQCVTAPWFVVLIVWANTSTEPRDLLMPTLYSLLASLVALLLVLLTTSPSRPPRWHFLLCFVGFAVSITWISTIANEVVGVLKTIGVIFNMSDAILGLTIFAVGNSLGDLVADVTVARLGYPVMALSACFGGPMLNILLGIGLSGLYMTIDKAEKHAHKHPGRPIKFKPYHVEVSTTLLISAAALLVTLVGLLIVIPLNGWKMDRKIGWGLIALWVVSTVGNVIVEITGIGEDRSMGMY